MTNDDSHETNPDSVIQENSTTITDAVNAAESEAAAVQQMQPTPAEAYYYQQLQQQQKNIIATEVTREQIISEFHRIINLHSYDSQDARFPLQIAKLFPLIQIYCYQQQEQIAKLMANEFWQQPIDAGAGVVAGTIDPSSTAINESQQSPATASAKSSKKSKSKSSSSSSHSKAPTTAVSVSSQKLSNAINSIEDHSRIKRELARQANPHLTRARSLIARAKLVLGHEASEDEIKDLAIQLLHQPRRTPKVQYRFDEYGNALVIEYINAWTNTKARRASLATNSGSQVSTVSSGNEAAPGKPSASKKRKTDQSNAEKEDQGNDSEGSSSGESNDSISSTEE